MLACGLDVGRLGGEAGERVWECGARSGFVLDFDFPVVGGV